MFPAHLADSAIYWQLCDFVSNTMCKCPMNKSMIYEQRVENVWDMIQALFHALSIGPHRSRDLNFYQVVYADVNDEPCHSYLHFHYVFLVLKKIFFILILHNANYVKLQTLQTLVPSITQIEIYLSQCPFTPNIVAFYCQFLIRNYFKTCYISPLSFSLCWINFFFNKSEPALPKDHLCLPTLVNLVQQFWRKNLKC